MFFFVVDLICLGILGKHQLNEMFSAFHSDFQLILFSFLDDGHHVVMDWFADISGNLAVTVKTK
jgi:hypothetical protein